MKKNNNMSDIRSFLYLKPSSFFPATLHSKSSRMNTNINALTWYKVIKQNSEHFYSGVSSGQAMPNFLSNVMSTIFRQWFVIQHSVHLINYHPPPFNRDVHICYCTLTESVSGPLGDRHFIVFKVQQHSAGTQAGGPLCLLRTSSPARTDKHGQWQKSSFKVVVFYHSQCLELFEGMLIMLQWGQKGHCKQPSYPQCRKCCHREGVS